MSYDLVFWRELKPINQTPHQIYEGILQDLVIDGLAELPLDKVKARFVEEFPGIEDALTQMDWEGDGSYFQLTWPPNPVNALIVTCGYKLLEIPDTMNRIIQVANEFGCALYDPQTDERFQQPET